MTLAYARGSGLALLAGVVLLLSGGRGAAQMTPDQAADMLLVSARRAYNEKQYPFAIARFREFLARFGGHKEAPAARYGLALALLGGPEKDHAAAFEQLQPLAGAKEFPDHPFVLYYLGFAQRGLGVKELMQAAAKPQEAAARKGAAAGRFSEAARHFAAAAAAFTARGKAPPADAKELPADLEWAARARCDQAEMLLRTLKLEEAQAAAAPFLADPILTRSRYRTLGLYYHGFACFLRKDYVAAGRSLNQTTPFTDPVFGTHARFLLARVHHQQDERAEAGLHYDGVIAEYTRQKQAAVEALKKPETFKNDPEEKARLEQLVKAPPPEHVAQALLLLGVLQYEDGKFAEALTRCTDFLKQFPSSPLAAEAQLRQGFCQVQLRQFAEAVRTLGPLAEKEPRLADQALLWMGKAQAGGADAANPAAYEQQLRAALDSFRRAAERAQQLAANDPDARARRGEILLEQGDTQQLLKQYREAAATYGQVLAEKLLPAREEEALQRQITALHLAGDFAESDKLVARFQQTYPKSTLLPGVLFRHAENAYFQALAAEKNPNLPNRDKELARLHEEAATRYRVVVERYPEFPYAPLARYGLGMSLYRKGDLEKARETLEVIPQPDRAGELAVVPYVLADIALRLAPAQAEDALAAGRLEEQLRGAAELLDSFLAGQPNAPQAPDALLKLGLCHQRLAALLAQPPDRAKALASARAAYERLIQQFAKHPLQPQAAFERARCLDRAGDRQGAVNELQRFQQDPLRAAPIAPMALVHLAQLLRGQNKASEAANVLAQCRQQHEAALAKDPERAAWIPVLQYQHGMALKEAGKLPEARPLFEQVVRQHPARPEAAEAALRWGQCLREEGLARLEAARKARDAAKKPEEQAAAAKLAEEGLKAMQEAAKYLEEQAEQVKQKQPTAEVRGRMLYEAAWASRAVAEAEVAAARARLAQELAKKQEAAKKPGAAPEPLQDPATLPVPLQPAEQKLRGLYQAVVAGFPDLPLANDARFELAELLAERGEHDGAIKLLHEALDKEPPAELTDRVRLRLGGCLAAKGDARAALTQFQVVAQNPKSPLAGQAHYRAGEVHAALAEWGEAVKYFQVFRDQPPFQNLPGLTDRGLLRLGHALAHLQQWDQSRQAHEQVVGRFGSSPWVHEARYGIGWAWQNQRQWDQAVNAYAQVTTGTTTEVGARAQLQIGLCRLEQKRFPDAAAALLVVPFTYEYPELNAVALCEAARALTELKQHDQAEKLLQRVLRDHAASRWAEVARDRLQGLKGG